MVVERERAEGEAYKAPGSGGGGGEPLPQEDDEETARGGREREVGDEPVEEEEQGRGVAEEKAEWSSEIRLAVEELSPAQREPGGGDDGGGKAAALSVPTLRFLALAHLLLRVLDKVGPTMAVLRLDVQRNIERLQELYLLDPCKYSTLTEIVEKEVKEGTARRVDSCARAVLWLTRSMDFALALLQRLAEEGPDQQSLAQATDAAYSATLKPWHGWIASAAYKIAMKLVPERKAFTSLLLMGAGQGERAGDPALGDDVGRLAPLLRPLLDDIHSMMAKFRLDRLKSA